MSHDIKSAERPAPDHVLTAIADYALSFEIKSDLAYETARYCLMDTLACGFQALKYPACTKLMGPVVPGATLTNGARVPGTAYELDPINAAFNIGAMIRWLDFNDTWLAAEWGHPSDNLGRHSRRGRLSVAVAASRCTVRDRADRHDQGARNPGRARARRTASTGSASIMCCWCASPPPPWSPRCSAARASRSSTRCRTRGSTAARCEPIGTRRTRARARAGPPATRPAARCAMRCSP